MTKFVLVSLCLFSFLIQPYFFLSPAYSQDALTWGDCVQLVIKKNTDLQAAKYNLLQNNYLVKAAYSGFLPVVNGTASYVHGNITSIPQIGGTSSGTALSSSTITSSITTTTTSISGTENIFNGFQNKGILNEAKGNKQVSLASYDNVKATVSYNLKSAFASLIYAQNYLRFSDDLVKSRKYNMEMVQRRYEGGNEDKGSFLQAKTLYDQSIYSALQAKDALAVAQKQMAYVLGQEDYTHIQIVGSVPLKAPLPPPDFYQLALQTPVHNQAVAQIKVAKAELLQAKSDFYPSVNLTGTALQRRDGFNTNDTTTIWQAGVGVSFNFLNGGNDYYSTKAAIANQMSASFTKKSVDYQTVVNLEQTYSSYVEIAQKVKIDQEALVAGQVRSEIAKARYNNGFITFEDWDLIVEDSISKELTALQSQENRIITEAAWEQAQGKGVIP